MDILSFLISAFFSAVLNLGGNQSTLPNTQEIASSPVASSENVAEIAQCLAEKGATFYGAFWCPHCADQKKRFGEEAMQYITYVECDPRGENAQPEACLNASVQSYPTWSFPGRENIIGAYDPQYLAEVAGCNE